MSAEVDALTAQVAASVAVETQAVTLIQNGASALASSDADMQKVAALTAQLKASTDALAAVVAQYSGAVVAIPVPETSPAS